MLSILFYICWMHFMFHYMVNQWGQFMKLSVDALFGLQYICKNA